MVGEKRIARLRRHASIDDPSSLPPIRYVILDFSEVSYIDTTACTHLKGLLNAIKEYGGSDVALSLLGFRIM